MGAFDTALKVGMENFGMYGKLIGTGKNNGLRVFEQLFDGKRILTTLGKDNNVVKTVTTSRLNTYHDRLADVSLYHINPNLKSFKLTEVVNKDGSEFMNFRGIFQGQTLYQRIFKRHASGETENLVVKLPYGGHNAEVKMVAQKGEKEIKQIQPLCKEISGAELSYTNNQPIRDGVSDQIAFRIGGEGRTNREVLLDAERLRSKNARPVEGSLKPNYKVYEGRVYDDANGRFRTYEYKDALRTDADGRVFHSRVPVYETQPKFAVPLNEHVRIPTTTVRGHFDSYQGNIETPNEERNIGKQIMENIYAYVEKMRGAAVPKKVS